MDMDPISLLWRVTIVGAVCISAFLQPANAQTTCPVANGYFPESYQCDAYIECKDGVPERKLCPDGLFFDDRVTQYPRYPCAYPQEVSCGSRTRTQPASSTGECPHQYGLFRSATQPGTNCAGAYVNCVAGKAYINQCPEGLVFNEEKIQCDWPDNVPGCDASAYLRFQCPGVRVDADLGHPRYADPGDCRKFFVCVENTKPRELSCGLGFVFNELIGVCDEPQNVPRCQNYYPRDVLEALQKLKSFDNRI